MKLPILALIALALCVSASASFVIHTPEEQKAAAEWEKRIRRDFDLEALHDFLERTVSEHGKFEGIDLTSSEVGKAWRVRPFRRRLLSGSWWFHSEEEGGRFQFRYYPGEEEREIVLLCERKRKRVFHLLGIRWDDVTIDLAYENVPNQSSELTLSVTTRPDVRPAEQAPGPGGAS